MLEATDHGHSTLQLGVGVITATTWVDLEAIMLSELCPSQKDKCYMIPLQGTLKLVKGIEVNNGMAVTGDAVGNRRCCSMCIKFQLYKSSRGLLEYSSYSLQEGIVYLRVC